MKHLFRFIPMLVLCGLSNVAHAFKLEILDPPTAGPFLYYANGTGPVGFQFGVCPSNLPPASSADGCFTVYNNTNVTYQSFSLAFDNYRSSTNPGDTYNFMNSQAANCDVSPSNTAFTTAPVCGLTSDMNSYNLVFSGGGRGFYPTEYIVIAEFGASPDAFRNGTFAVSPNVVTATPEPGSLWLLVTGAGLPAAGWWKQRRNQVRAHEGA